MSRAGSDTETQFMADLTEAHHQLRNLHAAQQPDTEIEYRGHQLVAENPEHPYPDAYELRTTEGELLLTAERSGFPNPDDWARYFDYAINQSPEKARDWYDNQFDGWWSQ